MKCFLSAITLGVIHRKDELFLHGYELGLRAMDFKKSTSAWV